MASFGREYCTVQHASKRVLHVLRSQRSAVMKTDAVAQVENISSGIGYFPAQRKIRNDFRFVVLSNERIEYQFGEMLGRGILADARIKAVGILVERHCNAVWISRVPVGASCD